MKRKAFFFIGDGRRTYQGYSHSAVLVAEGLLELGWQICSNIPAWQAQPHGPYLFPGSSPEDIEEADLIIFAEEYFLLQGSDLLPPIPKNAAAPKIYLDRSDLTAQTSWPYGSALRELDMVFRCHSSGYFRYPDHFRPLAFGITSRMQLAADASRSEKQTSVIWNFNPNSKYPHSARLWAERRLKPALASFIPLSTTRTNNSMPGTEYEALMRTQTDGRHYSGYYQELGRASACCCIGGWFLIPVRQREAGPFCMRTRTVLRRLAISTRAVAQWDSWRLWEAFTSGCAVLHFNFEESEFLPGGPLPEALVHYIPVSRSSPKESLEVLADLELTMNIAEAGRRWAMEHYSSLPIVQRLLKQIDDDLLAG